MYSQTFLAMIAIDFLYTRKWKIDVFVDQNSFTRERHYILILVAIEYQIGAHSAKHVYQIINEKTI